MSAPGWTNTKHDTGGVNELVSDEGCQFVTTQNLFEGQPSSDREETDIQAQNEIQKFSQGVTNVSFKPAQDDATSVKDSSGNPIETKRLDWTYTGKDGKDLSGHGVSQGVHDHQETDLPHRDTHLPQ